jgi:caffeoyl-CoA O-methyltransferase
VELLKIFQEKSPLESFCLAHSSTLPSYFDRHLEERGLKGPPMEIGPWIGALLQLLVRANGSRRILEIGTYSGYSALALAEALPTGGYLLSVDKDARAIAVAQKFLQDHRPPGVEIELMQADAHTALDSLQEQFCFVFIDADKRNALPYWQKSKRLLRKGGLLIVDNVLRKGSTLLPDDPKGQPMRELLLAAQTDPDFHSITLPLRDGLLLSQLR